MGPTPACAEPRPDQEEADQSSGSTLRPRACLLKGCGRWYTPQWWSQRYCSKSCRAEADRWRQRKSAREYRRSEAGKARRAEQSRRRRQRQAQDAADREVEQDAESAPSAPCEGHHPFEGEGEFCCARPGCYVLFDRTARSPLQRFCSSACREALRRVRAREALWRVRAFFRRHLRRWHSREGPRRRCRI